ncbi:Multidrug resistance transporter, Bcr family [Granulibacter bethesdensis]|uniref:Bcr/CflA family efflux transporter n=1 Tax=Granulibacter bethesdensis TaxID=364410 RepID=A0AAC9K5V2_9PROT|nr:multidrug effflux MFS transporter [Granulibacter bethesdensis]APH53281.1 Multidrug resistance transporter, Bcr family [Granulibacter bethesdensis]APH60856.1 Multidrug resistance transporter, Bcr family [Granulibacter bethesdensis]
MPSARLSVPLIILLGLVTSVGPMSTDMYLPAFPQLQADIGGHYQGAAQITLAAWFVGLAIGHLTNGTLSDRFGRRVPLIAGMLIYTLASTGCALATDLWSFTLFRLIAALGGSAGMVTPRAIVRDMSDGHEAARLISRLMLIMGVVPLLAPTLGGMMLSVMSWRAIFWLGSLYGAVCVVLVIVFLPDTLPPEKRLMLSPGSIMIRYGTILRERVFITHAMLSGFCVAALFTYLAGSPSAFIQYYHISPTVYGMIFGMNAVGYIGCSQLNNLALPRLGMHLVLRIGTTLYLGLVSLLMVNVYTGLGGLVGMMILLFLAQSIQGFLTPTAAVGALSPHAAHAGSASALMGTLQYVLGALFGTGVAVLADGTPRPMVVFMLLGGICSLIGDRLRPGSRGGGLPLFRLRQSMPSRH